MEFVAARTAETAKACSIEAALRPVQDLIPGQACLASQRAGLAFTKAFAVAA